MNICPQNIRLKEHQKAVVNRESIVKYGRSYEEKKVGRSSPTLTEIHNRQRRSNTIQQDKRIMID